MSRAITSTAPGAVYRQHHTNAKANKANGNMNTS